MVLFSLFRDTDTGWIKKKKKVQTPQELDIISNDINSYKLAVT